MAKPTIYGIKDLLDYIQKCDCNYFKLVVSDNDADKKGSCLLTNYKKENQTVADVIREVTEYCERIKIRGGDFTIWLTTKANTNLPDNRQLVEIPPAFGPLATSGISGPGNEGNTQEMIDKAVANALNAFKKEQELEQLRKDLAEAKRELRESQPGPLERVIGRVEPYITPFLESQFPMDANKAAAAATSQVAGNGPEIDENTQKEIEDALIYLSSDDPEFFLIIKMMANLKKTNPAMYQMARNYLKSQNNG
jgi:hypothetical protein